MIHPTSAIQRPASNMAGSSFESLFAFWLMCFSSFCPIRFRGLVGSSGLEPPTSRLSGVRSNRLSYEPISDFGVSTHFSLGGDERVRTDDPLLAKQVLSQLSYTPVFLEGSHLQN